MPNASAQRRCLGGLSLRLAQVSSATGFHGSVASTQPAEVANAPPAKKNLESLLADVPYDRVTKWTTGSPGIGRDEFGELMQYLIELDAASAVDITSMSHDLATGSRQACAISFVRLRML